VRRLETLRSGTACLALLRNAQEHADPPHRHLHPKVGDEVEFFGTDKGVEATDAEFANPGLERIHLSSGEHPAEQAAMDSVDGRILEDGCLKLRKRNSHRAVTANIAMYPASWPARDLHRGRALHSHAPACQLRFSLSNGVSDIVRQHQGCEGPVWLNHRKPMRKGGGARS